MKLIPTLLLLTFLSLDTLAGDLYRTRGPRPVYHETSEPYLGQVFDPEYTDAYGDTNPTRFSAAQAIFSGSTIANVETWPAHIEPTGDIAADCGDYHQASYDGEGFTQRRGNYNLTANQRAALVQELIAEGRRLGRPPERAGTTTMTLGGQQFDVMNDAVTLPDGTYINLTIDEARELGQAYGCRLPNYDEAETIREFARAGRDGSVLVNGLARDNDSPGMRAMNSMMNDQRMLELARRGQDQLINGHFKWYIDDGSNQFRFYGFRACGSGYCQNRGSSGGHNRQWIDYSQSARYICPRGVRT